MIEVCAHCGLPDTFYKAKISETRYVVLGQERIDMVMGQKCRGCGGEGGLKIPLREWWNLCVPIKHYVSVEDLNG
jgi:hypothetical protein